MSIVQARVPVVWRPQPRQAEFMSRPEPEALYGGAAGGGKSDALVIEALRQTSMDGESDAAADCGIRFAILG